MMHLTDLIGTGMSPRMTGMVDPSGISLEIPSLVMVGKVLLATHLVNTSHGYSYQNMACVVKFLIPLPT